MTNGRPMANGWVSKNGKFSSEQKRPIDSAVLQFLEKQGVITRRGE